MDSNFVDSLPSGWTMKERIRENGKRDKYYFAPQNGPTFNSRVEVYRYLGVNSINHYKAKKKKKRALKKPWRIIAVEKVKAEDLPPGWIGEIQVNEKDQNIRRDRYYIDHVSKATFRSLKAVYRHLGIEEPGAPSQNSGDDYSSISADGQSEASKTRIQISFGQSAAMDEPIEDHQRHSLSYQQLFESEQPSEQAPEEAYAQLGLRKSKKKKAADLPRRSKRLAGIEVDSIELKPKTRARGVDAQQSGNEVPSAETTCGFEPPKSTESSHQSSYSNTDEFSSDNLVPSVTGFDAKHNKADLKIRAPLGLPLAVLLSDPCIAFAVKTLTSSDLSSVNLGTDLPGIVKLEDDKTEAKRGQSEDTRTESPFGGAWKDQSIEFAVKTLTNELKATSLGFDYN